MTDVQLGETGLFAHSTDDLRMRMQRPEKQLFL